MRSFRVRHKLMFVLFSFPAKNRTAECAEQPPTAPRARPKPAERPPTAADDRADGLAADKDNRESSASPVCCYTTNSKVKQVSTLGQRNQLQSKTNSKLNSKDRDRGPSNEFTHSADRQSIRSNVPENCLDSFVPRSFRHQRSASNLDAEWSIAKQRRKVSIERNNNNSCECRRVCSCLCCCAACASHESRNGDSVTQFASESSSHPSEEAGRSPAEDDVNESQNRNGHLNRCDRKPSENGVVRQNGDSGCDGDLQRLICCSTNAFAASKQTAQYFTVGARENGVPQRLRATEPSSACPRVPCCDCSRALVGRRVVQYDRLREQRPLDRPSDAYVFRCRYAPRGALHTPADGDAAVARQATPRADIDRQHQPTANRNNNGKQRQRSADADSDLSLRSSEKLNLAFSGQRKQPLDLLSRPIAEHDVVEASSCAALRAPPAIGPTQTPTPSTRHSESNLCKWPISSETKSAARSPPPHTRAAASWKSDERSVVSERKTESENDGTVSCDRSGNGAAVSRSECENKTLKRASASSAVSENRGDFSVGKRNADSLSGAGSNGRCVYFDSKSIPVFLIDNSGYQQVRRISLETFSPTFERSDRRRHSDRTSARGEPLPPVGRATDRSYERPLTDSSVRKTKHFSVSFALARARPFGVSAPRVDVESVAKCVK